MTTVPKVLFVLALLAPTTAWGQDFTGRYLYQSPQGPVELVLQHVGAEVQGTLTGVDGQVSRLVGAREGAGATGTISIGEMTGWFAVGFLGEGLTLLVAEIDPTTGQPNIDDGWRLDFARIAAADPAVPPGPMPGAARPGHAQPDAAAASSPLVQQWLQQLRGKKVTFVESYGSSGGGYSNRWEAYLCSDMRFFFRSSGQVAADVGDVSGHGYDRNSFSGTWRIIEHAGQAVLQYQRTELAGTDQGEWVALSHRGGQTFFDSSRVYVTSDNTMCP
jgi:hypothetical protein